MNKTVTLTTDWGLQDAYVAMMKASLWQHNEELNIMDITHQVVPHNIYMAACYVRQSARFFAPGTIHIVDVAYVKEDDLAQYTRYMRSHNVEKDFYYTDYVAFELNGQYYMCQNNGLVYAIAEDDTIGQVVQLKNMAGKGHKHGTFPALDYYAWAAAQLAMPQYSLQDIGTPYDVNKLQSVIIPKAMLEKDGNTITAQVKYVDAYGNVVTNIRKDDFERWAHGRSKFKFRYSNTKEEVISSVGRNYNEIVSKIKNMRSNIFFVFGVHGYLEVGYHNSNLALHYNLNNDGIMNGSFYFEFID